MSAKKANRGLTILALAVAGIAITGCAHKRTEVTHSVPRDYNQRHPINVGYKSSDLAISPSVHHQGMSPADRTELIGFLRAYRNDAETMLQVTTPSGSPNEALTHAIIEEIRLHAAGEGIRSENIYVQPYDAGADPNAPVRLSYGAFSAIAPQCGQWPASIDSGAQNNNYHNFGCATQRNLAEMVANPRDLVGPQTMDPSDPGRRRTVMDKYRKGEDTATIRTDPNAGQVAKVNN